MSDSSTTRIKAWAWQTWQFLVIPASYPVFVLGSLIMISLIPVARLRFRHKASRVRWLRGVLHQGAKLWVALNSLLGILRVDLDDLRRDLNPDSPLSQPEPLLVIANHPSLIDVLLITAAMPNLCCVLKGALHYNPLFALLIRNLDYLPNSDPELMLERGTARLIAGERLLIFPEGTRTRPGAPLNFRMGAAELAVRSGATVLPVTIHSNSRYLSKGYPWYRWPTVPLHYRLELGPLLEPRLAETVVSTCDAWSKKARRTARRAVNERWQKHFVQRLESLSVGNCPNPV